jgi:hypothetical protein
VDLPLAGLFGFLASGLVIQALLRWGWSVWEAIDQYRVAVRYPHLGRANHLWTLLPLLVLHSGPWILALFAFATLRLLSAPHQSWHSWVIGGFIAYPIFVSSILFSAWRRQNTGRAMSTYQLAQLNIAQMKERLESPSMADFVANLDQVNALADSAPGFVWRLEDEAGGAVGMRPFGEDLLVNMSVWDSVASLSSYAFRSDHAEIMRRRREWFKPMSADHAVLWWVATGHRPSLAEAKERLDHLRLHGATPYAFTFKNAFPAPDVDSPE